MVLARCIGITDHFIEESGLKEYNMVKGKCGKMTNWYKKECSKMENLSLRITKDRATKERVSINNSKIYSQSKKYRLKRIPKYCQFLTTGSDSTHTTMSDRMNSDRKSKDQRKCSIKVSTKSRTSYYCRRRDKSIKDTLFWIDTQRRNNLVRE